MLLLFYFRGLVGSLCLIYLFVIQDDNFICSRNSQKQWRVWWLLLSGVFLRTAIFTWPNILIVLSYYILLQYTYRKRPKFEVTVSLAPQRLTIAPENAIWLLRKNNNKQITAVIRLKRYRNWYFNHNLSKNDIEMDF